MGEFHREDVIFVQINFLKNLLVIIRMETFARSTSEEREDVNALRYIGSVLSSSIQ